MAYQSTSIPSISEDTARDAFALYASSNCCYSSAPAKDGVIANMEAFNTYRDSKQVIKVPYTSSMKKVCWVCNGSGFRHGDDRCSHCGGRGREKINNSSDYVVEQSSGLELENLNKVTGKELFKDAHYMRQTIELIPITKVTYRWKGNSHIYFVYGNEFKVS
ncbi:hypothetical protein CRUP_000287, partial [Coryphaenoides rupestris]